MRSYRALVKAAQLQLVRETRFNLFAQSPCGVAMIAIEIHVGVPAMNDGCGYD